MHAQDEVTSGSRKNRHPIDEYGDLKVQIDALTKQLEAKRQELLAAYPEGQHEGEDYGIVVGTMHQRRLDTEVLKAYLPAEQIEACMKQISFPKLALKIKAPKP